MQKNKRPEFIQIQNHYFKVDDIFKISKYDDVYVCAKETEVKIYNITPEDIIKRMKGRNIKED